MEISALFIDLDDTLYPASSGLWFAIKERISLYMRLRLGIPEKQIPILRQRYFEEYGTTLRGLSANFSVDAQDYLTFVHDLPLKDYLHPNLDLRAALRSLSIRKMVFTNADAAHANRVLGVLGISDCFDGIVDVNAVAPYCKPMPESFAIALALAGQPDARQCVLIDDLPRTTRAARAQGMFSILFGEQNPHPDADAVLTDWKHLRLLLNGEKP